MARQKSHVGSDKTSSQFLKCILNNLKYPPLKWGPTKQVRNLVGMTVQPQSLKIT